MAESLATGVHDHAGSRVVVGVDGSDASRDGLRWAARQARMTGASLHAVMAWHVPITAYNVPMRNLSRPL
ncbi:MAG: universal stress protein, partial [Acidimicrobiales bacterium]